MGKVYKYLIFTALNQIFKSYSDYSYVLHGLDMTYCNTVMALEFHSSYGTILLDHLAADGAGFPAGQVTVVAVGQVDTHLPWCPFYILNSPDKGVPTGF